MQVDLVSTAGRLEALLEEPLHPGSKGPEARFAAIVCHPHPLFGGTMHTHAAYRMARAVRARGGTALRFNFRGVGRSAGRYDGGDGEVDDARAALSFLASAKPGLPLLACGFSFGAWMALLAGRDDPRVRGILLAGLALRAPDFAGFRESGRVREVEKPVAVVQAEGDELGSPEDVRAAMEGSRGPRRLATVKGATHLFTEDLPALQREVEAALDWLVLGGGSP
jgi:alpha/beta superfamily hydrolase